MKLTHVIAALAGLVAATSAHAGYATGKVGQVMVGRNSDQVYVELLAAEFSAWPCTTTHPSGFRYSFLLDDKSKSILATILMAKATGQDLQVIGKGTCTLESSLEDLHYVVLRP